MDSDAPIDAPLGRLLRTEAADPMILAAALAGAASAMARLDQALASHPLAQAFLYRARLESVRRQAAVDGQLIDPWHLAASIEGLRLRMDPCLRIIDRGAILDRARAALTLHQWIVEPDFDQEGEVQRAEAMLSRQPASLPPLIAAAQGFRGWIASGETRPAMRAAMIRFWRKRQLFRLPVPLTGAAALQSGQSWDPDDWLPAFLGAIDREACDGLDLLYAMERAWFSARGGVARRRKDAHDAAAVDVLAATPVFPRQPSRASSGSRSKTPSASSTGWSPTKLRSRSRITRSDGCSRCRVLPRCVTPCARPTAPIQTVGPAGRAWRATMRCRKRRPRRCRR